MWDWIAKLQELREARAPFVAVTVVECAGSTPRDPGAKMLVLADGFFGTIGGGRLELLALEEARKILAEGGESRKIRYPLGAKTGQCCGGIVELFFDAVNRCPELYVFGAGHVGLALVRTLTGTPFRVHLIDPRAEWVGHVAIPGGVVRHECAWDEFVADARWSARDVYVAVMTHEHAMDQDIIADVVNRETRYVGLIGSVSKWERFKQRYSSRGLAPACFERVRCPIGLHVAGKAPQEVAISVAAELLAEYYGAPA
ncbi:MAG: xanthine dehydrogenase accessory protein XdhC [Deltaproteobacteria bacterium]|nr:xanthine dehydrogenase accessory protein XdhC [Deltaproteobacteria bacterium]